MNKSSPPKIGNPLVRLSRLPKEVTSSQITETKLPDKMPPVQKEVSATPSVGVNVRSDIKSEYYSSMDMNYEEEIISEMFKTKNGSPIKINFLCDLCDHVATKYNNLLRHQRSKHQGKSDLHKATVHNNDEDNSQLFCCPLCPFAAISKKSLTMHKQKMHAVKTEMVKAPILKDAATAGGNKRTKMFSKDIFIPEKVDLSLSKTGELYHCDQCLQKFTRVNNLKKHIKIRHLGVRFDCDQCEFTTSEHFLLRNHKAARHNIGTRPKHYCKYSGCKFFSHYKHMTTRHEQKAHEGKTFPCDQCEFEGSCAFVLKRHIESIHEKIRYYCELCEYSAGQKHEITIHYRKKHPLPQDDAPDQVATPKKKGLVKDEVKTDEEDEGGEMSDASSHDDTGGSNAGLLLEISDLLWKQPQKFRFYDRLIYDQGYLSKKESKELKQRSKRYANLVGIIFNHEVTRYTMCTNCGLVQRKLSTSHVCTNSTVTKDMEDIMKNKPVEVLNKSRLNGDLYKHFTLKGDKAECKRCKQVLSSVDKFQKHLRIEHADLDTRKKRACKDCGKQFISQTSLDQHRLEKHAKTKLGRFECDKCSRLFVNNYLLNAHFKIKHGNVKSYKCELCPETFEVKLHLAKHKRTHSTNTGEKTD